MKKFVSLLLACLFAGSAMSTVLSHNVQRFDLSQAVQVLEDKTGALSMDDVRRPEVSLGFQTPPTNGGDLNWGFTSSAYWLRIALQRAENAPANWLLEIPYAQISEVAFYAPGEPRILTGSEQPLISRAYFHRFFIFPVKLSTETQYVYLRVASRNALTVPLSVWQTDAFNQQLQRTLLVQSLYYGGLLALLLYNLFLFFSLRDTRFLLYSLYALSMGLGMLAGNGYGRLFVWPDSPAFDEVAQSLFLSMAGAFGVMFSRKFLRASSDFHVINRLLQICSVILFANALLLLASTHWTLPVQALIAMLMVISFVTGALIITASVQSIRQGNRSARFFLLAWGILWTGVFVATLRAFGWLPTNILTAYILQISSAAEMLLLSLALADIIHGERKSRITAQAIAIDSTAKMLETLKSSEEKLERTVLDRTEQLETSLQHQKKLLAQYIRFGSLVSHEFRNPLSIISSQLSLLGKEHDRGLDNMNKRLLVMRSATNRLALMFDKWLQNDGLSHSLENITPRLISLQAWLHNLVDANDYCLDGHQIELHFGSDVLQIEGDEYLLEIAISNLLENASKYSEKDTVITLETRAKPGYLGIAVTDQGLGIPPEHHASVFNEFFRMAPEGAIRGMGLGLPIVKRIVDAHGGHIQLDSSPSGSSFCVWLPTIQREHTHGDSV